MWKNIEILKLLQQKEEKITKLSFNKIFHRAFIGNRNEKTQILMNKPVYLGLSILDRSKTLIYEFWYDYLQPKYGENVKLCYMDTDRFIVHVKTDHIYKEIPKVVEIRFDTSYFEIDRPLPKSKNKKVIGQLKDELRRQVMKEFERSWIKSKNIQLFKRKQWSRWKSKRHKIVRHKKKI